MPDGEFLPPFELNCVEQHLKESFLKNYGDRHLVHAVGRISQNPNRCISTRAGANARQEIYACAVVRLVVILVLTHPHYHGLQNWAILTVRPFSVVHSIIYDEQKHRAAGVRVIDAETKEATEFFARIVFVNGSSLNSNLILLNSTSNRFPNGLGNDSGILGKYICHHNYRGWMSGKIEGFEDKYVYGRNPTDAIIANYRNLAKIDTDFGRRMPNIYGRLSRKRRRRPLP